MARLVFIPWVVNWELGGWQPAQLIWPFPERAGSKNKDLPNAIPASVGGLFGGKGPLKIGFLRLVFGSMKRQKEGREQLFLVAG